MHVPFVNVTLSFWFDTNAKNATANNYVNSNDEIYLPLVPSTSSSSSLLSSNPFEVNYTDTTTDSILNSTNQMAPSSVYDSLSTSTSTSTSASLSPSTNISTLFYSLSSQVMTNLLTFNNLIVSPETMSMSSDFGGSETGEDDSTGPLQSLVDSQSQLPSTTSQLLTSSYTDGVTKSTIHSDTSNNFLNNLTLITESDLISNFNLTFADLVEIAYGIKVLEPNVHLSSLLPCWKSASSSTSTTSSPSSSSSSLTPSTISSSTPSASSFSWTDFLPSMAIPSNISSSSNYPPHHQQLPSELQNCASVIYNFSSYLLSNDLSLFNYNDNNNVNSVIGYRFNSSSIIELINSNLTTTFTNGDFYNNNLPYSIIESTTIDTDAAEKPEKVYWALCLVILPFLAVFGNILVILSVYREKSLQTVTNYFIVSLAFADLLVAGVVMPFAVYYLINVDWELSETLCDLWVAVDVTCSTASILNLVAISIDRFIAVTRPIKYAKHKSNTRVSLTIGIVWIVSAAIGSPIVFGLNTSAERRPELCIFYNSDFIFLSSLGSFYIPCVLMVFLYYKIFKAIHDRAKMSIGSKNKATSSTDSSHTVLVIENKSETAKLKERTGFLARMRNPTSSGSLQAKQGGGGGNREGGSAACNNKNTLLGNSGLGRKSPLPKILEAEGYTNNGSGSIEDDEDDDRELDGNGCSGGVIDSLECHIIANKQTGLEECCKPMAVKENNHENKIDINSSDDAHNNSSSAHCQGCRPLLSAEITKSSEDDTKEINVIRHNCCVDSGYGPSAFEETPFCVYNPTAETQLTTSSSRPASPRNKASNDDGAGFGAMVTSSSSSGGCGESQELNNNKNTNDSNLADSNNGKSNKRIDRIVGESNHSSNENGLKDKQQQQKPVKKRSRFNLGRKPKTSAKRREKASAKRERKATKTLAIVLGVFLVCWAPFFTCNIIDAVCIKLKSEDCKPGMNAFLLTTWLGYMNSCVNPVIYTIFNPEFRKAFKKIIKSTFSSR